MTTTYEQRFVSFIDIVGFVDAIERPLDDAALPAGMRRILSISTSSSPLHGPPAQSRRTRPRSARAGMPEHRSGKVGRGR